MMQVTLYAAWRCDLHQNHGVSKWEHGLAAPEHVARYAAVNGCQHCRQSQLIVSLSSTLRKVPVDLSAPRLGG